jgi:hypothetical protein
MKTAKEPTAKNGNDLVLLEMWRIKDELSAARSHNAHRLFSAARKHQMHSGRRIVNRQNADAGSIADFKKTRKP